MEMRRHGDKEAWGHGDGDMVIWRHGDMETWWYGGRWHGHMEE